MGEGGGTQMLLQKNIRFDSIGPEKLYRYTDILSFDVLLSFDSFQSLFYDQFTFIYLIEELKTHLKQVYK